MTVKGIGALHRADEGLNHQIVDTFATVAQSDRAWTEKIWGSLARTDGSLQVDFGLGRYHNRGIIDGFGGVSRGPEQWTVRASRELAPAPEDTAVGPVRYEIVEPLSKARFVLEPNDVLPISFDIVLTGVTPPFFEERNLVRDRTTGRVDIDVVRYHQAGHASGTLTLDGETHEVRPEEWFGARDHSWGVRQGVGQALRDVIPLAAPAPDVPSRSMMIWSPSFFRRPDGSYYETAIFLSGGVWDYQSAYVNEADGRQDLVRRVRPKLTYDPVTRFVRHGEIVLEMDSGTERRIEVEAPGDSGFFLRTAGYGPWGDTMHGVWRGPLHIDGEYLADCWDDEHRRRLGQFRDTPIRVREGDAVGFGIMESIVAGVWPEFGLTADSDIRISYA
jgi:hypothetical protein